MQKAYELYASTCDRTIKLSDLIVKTGIPCKNDEWYNDVVVDLSTMEPSNMFVDGYSDGSTFKTNIKKINNFDMVYGSIRPYFKKAGYVINVSYACGTVFSFNVKNKTDYLWTLATITNEGFHKYTNVNSEGTKMPVIKWNTFCQYSLPYPNDEFLKSFNNLVGSLFEYVSKLILAKQKLKTLKSLLLKKYFK